MIRRGIGAGGAVFLVSDESAASTWKNGETATIRFPMPQRTGGLIKLHSFEELCDLLAVMLRLYQEYADDHA